MTSPFPFYVVLSDLPGTVITVNSADRSRSFSSLGWLWNSDSTLDCKPFRLNVIEGDFAQEMKKRDALLTELPRERQTPHTPMTIPPDTIGAIAVRPGAEPGEWEPPFQAAVYLNRADYDASIEVINAAQSNDRLVSITLSVRPEMGAKFCRDDSAYNIYSVRDVDLADGFKGDVIGITIGQTIDERISEEERPVELPKDSYKITPRTNIDVTIKSISIEYGMPSGYLQTFKLDGLLRSRGEPEIDGVECDITLNEYERDDNNRYPERSLSGSFFWYKSVRSLSVDLWYRRSDLRDRFRMLTSSSPGDFVRLNLTLHVDVADFRLDEQRGDISSWGISCLRKLG